MSNLEKHKVDHLLLLLGKNPLPNAVAGELLIKPDGSITMLYTSDTGPAVRNLERFFDGKAKLNPPVQIDETDSHSIFKGIFKALNEDKSQSIGLHYTGGTKAMSVHAYRAVERCCRQGRQLVFSYLDARSLQMVFDPVDPESDSSERIYVGNQVEISLEQLISLHGWAFNKKQGKPMLPVRRALLPELASALALAHLASDSIYAWKTWRSTHINQGRIWPLPDSPLLTNVRKVMEEVLCCSSGQIEVENSAKKLGIGDRDLKLWLDGFWLEHHVLQCLTELSGEGNLKDCCQATKIAVPGGTDFDLDVVALHSYQLFAFSCGVRSEPDKKTELKLKLFEVFVRARQLGGDEARIALVSTSPDPDGLQSEIRNEYDSEERIKVFGQPHLRDLKSAIASWIKEQSHIQ